MLIFQGLRETALLKLRVGKVAVNIFKGLRCNDVSGTPGKIQGRNGGHKGGLLYLIFFTNIFIYF